MKENDVPIWKHSSFVQQNFFDKLKGGFVRGLYDSSRKSKMFCDIKAADDIINFYFIIFKTKSAWISVRKSCKAESFLFNRI